VSIQVGLFDERRKLGIAGTLRISQGTGDFWQSSAGWSPQARDAVREAYRAASKLVTGLPPRLHRHQIMLTVPGHKPVIDGPSLALPAALAFIAEWTGLTIPPDVAATGELRGQTVAPVGGVAEKAQALRGSGTSTMLVPPGQGGEPGLLEVGDLEQALDALGWTTLQVRRAASLSTVRSRAQDLCNRVRQQDLSDHRQLAGSVPPWIALGDELLICSELLTDAMPPEAVKARCYAALSFAHAGSPLAVHLLKDVPLGSVPASAQLLHAIAVLATALNGDPSPTLPALIQNLHQLRQQTSPADRRDVDGMALGTLGRAHMHSRMFQQAEPLLQAAVSAHSQSHPWETGRSLVYLAGCQRLAGRTEAARTTLVEARKELVSETQRFDPMYYRSCLMFWFYEAARTTLDAGDADRAYNLALLGLSSFDAYGGWQWPGSGLHRTAAWACRAKGWKARADRHVEALDRLIGDQPGNAALARIQQEARGPHRLDGEIY
jgi:hypothetical protein